MKATVLVGAGMMTMACATAHAQVAIAPVDPPAATAAQTAPPQAVSAAPAAGRTGADARREEIRMMEIALTQALQRGAQDLARQLKVSEPNSLFVTGNGRARGFPLEGYGVFFDVDVPGMKQSVVWSVQMVQLGQDRERAIQVLANTRPDDPLRRVAEAQIRQIDRLMAAAQGGGVLLPNPGAPTQLARDRVDAATVQVATDAVGAAPTLRSEATEVRDPNELYTESVKNALIDAMLKYSGFLKLGDNEWLTVAASDSDGPQVPGQLDDASRIVIRVKGSDLAAFQSGKISRDDMLKKVEVREY